MKRYRTRFRSRTDRLCCASKNAKDARGGGKGILIDADGKAFTISTLHDQAICYDARGNGGGGITPSLTGDHQNRITDYTAIVVEKRNERTAADS